VNILAIMTIKKINPISAINLKGIKTKAKIIAKSVNTIFIMINLGYKDNIIFNTI
jgi:hypothetical protein